MPLTYGEIQVDLVAGLTLQDIADKYNGDKRTITDVDNGDFSDYLIDADLLSPNLLDGGYSGLLRGQVADRILQKMLLRLESNSLRTSRRSGANIVEAILTSLSGDDKINFRKFVKNAGTDFQYKGIDLASVTAVFDAGVAAEAEIVRQDSIFTVQSMIENTWINPAIADGVSTSGEVIIAIKTGL